MNETEHDVAEAIAPPVKDPDTGLGGLAQSIGTRNLWIVILAMPAVFLVVVAVIIALFGKSRRDDAEIAAPVAVEESAPVEASIPAAAPITLGAGEAAGAIALDGDRLAVRIDGPDGVVVVIYDIAKREEIARIPIAQD